MTEISFFTRTCIIIHFHCFLVHACLGVQLFCSAVVLYRCKMLPQQYRVLLHNAIIFYDLKIYEINATCVNKNLVAQKNLNCIKWGIMKSRTIEKTRYQNYSA